MYKTKLLRIGNSTGVTLPRDILSAAKLDRGDAVTVEVKDGRIEIAAAGDDYAEAMAVGRRFAARYRRTMADLAK
ncbi:MAG TPA: AbrB/MazE/SpoVT family DNA-binding domain-containing protein [Azospirillaceae bacterium]|nr:AbrB/MazE/SpoVT family DNA-binding domain-containing protein [Azospirillaceae bacterium]